MSLKIAEIVPLKFLELTKDNQYHMCLAHLVLKSEKYRDFYKRMSDEGKYVIVDNGAAEDQSLNYDDLMAVYNMINPSEIILPDVLFNRSETIKRTREFLNSYDLSGYKKMIVPQGIGIREWFDCYRELEEIPDISVIGIPKWLGKDNPEIRPLICKTLERVDKEIHLLGCSEYPGAIKLCATINERVRSCDSAFAYLCSKAGIDKIEEKTKRPGGVIDFLNDEKGDNLERLLYEFKTITGGIR